MDLRYRNIKCSAMSDDDIAACAKLFSEHYGVWVRDVGGRKKGDKIRLSAWRK